MKHRTTLLLICHIIFTYATSTSNQKDHPEVVEVEVEASSSTIQTHPDSRVQILPSSNNNKVNQTKKEWIDKKEECRTWAQMGECTKNPFYMLRVCKKSCSNQAVLDALEFGHHEKDEEEVCVDEDHRCEYWAGKGECAFNVKFMMKVCPMSCFVCKKKTDLNKLMKEIEEDDESCQDKSDSEECLEWARKGECSFNAEFMFETCKQTCGACRFSVVRDINFGPAQTIPPSENRNTTLALIENSIHYMRRIMSSKTYAPLRHKCRNQQPTCTQLAAAGMCHLDRKMLTVCAPACNKCDMLEYKKRCPVDPRMQNALVKSGDLNALFARMMRYEEYFVRYGMLPIYAPYGSFQNKAARHRIGPWFVEFNHLLTDEECDAIISYAENKGMTKSKQLGLPHMDGTGTEYEYVDDHRSSSQTWCDPNECQNDPIIGTVLQRLANIVNLPIRHAEPLQVLRYEEGESYRTHTDYIATEVDHPEGVRILTFFLYLNDVEKGGETRFDELHGMEVVPKRGKGILWSNVVDEDPDSPSYTTIHESLVVERGRKYAANLWFHQRDFMRSVEMNCVRDY